MAILTGVCRYIYTPEGNPVKIFLFFIKVFPFSLRQTDRRLLLELIEAVDAFLQAAE